MGIYNEKQQNIAKKIDPNAARENWLDWTWQQKHAITNYDELENVMGIALPKEDKDGMKETLEKFQMSIPPYYLSLIDIDNIPDDPIYKESIPAIKETMLQTYEMQDPLHEEIDSPVPHLTHRYPDRVLLHANTICSMYCRFCTRKRKVGDLESKASKEDLKAAIDYIRNHKEVRDIIIGGGDPLMLSDHYIDWLLGELRSIEHVEIIRIGTRMPVVLPYRITDNLLNIIKKYHPIYINTHFNHPNEITESSSRELNRLADAGIPLGNQSVLLAGINDSVEVMKELNHKLVKNRVKPYYIYQCDLSQGLSHFRTPISKGIEIMEGLIGHTSGLAIPRYVVDAPGGGGKIPIMPNYIVSQAPNKVILRNYEGVITVYQEPENYQETLHYDNKKAGIRKLIDDKDKTESLIPAQNERYQRRS